MGLASACPFCSCLDVRAMNDPALEMVGFRCHDCQRVFYIGTVKVSKPEGKNAAGPDSHPPPQPDRIKG